MNKPPFSREKAVRVAKISNQIEGYEPVKDRTILKKVQEYVSKEK